MTRPSPAGGAALLLLAYVAFVSLGLPDGLLGVGWPSMSDDVGASTDALGLLLVAATAGYLVSSSSAGFLVERVGVGRLLAGSTAAVAVALTGFALSPGLALLLPSAFAGGVGGGAVDAALNAHAARTFGARHMNWLHASFGLGAALGPFVMTLVLGSGTTWRVAYALVAGSQVVLAIVFARRAGAWAGAPADETDVAGAGGGEPVRATLAMPRVWLGAVAFAVYTGVEVGAGLWAFLLLTDGRGLGVTAAGLCVTGYWASLFVGRIVQGAVAERIGTSRVLVGSLYGMALGALLVALPVPVAVTVAGLTLLALSAAPVYPLLTLTTAERVGAGHATRAIGLQVAAAAVGAAALPALVGVLLVRTDVDLLGSALLALALLLVVLHAATRGPQASEARA